MFCWTHIIIRYLFKGDSAVSTFLSVLLLLLLLLLEVLKYFVPKQTHSYICTYGYTKYNEYTW